MAYYGYGPMFDGWGGHGFGFLFMLLGLIVLIALVVGIIQLLTGSGRHSSIQKRNLETDRQARRSEALHILEKRFAHGEIDEEEFLKRRRILKEQD